MARRTLWAWLHERPRLREPTPIKGKCPSTGRTPGLSRPVCGRPGLDGMRPGDEAVLLRLAISWLRIDTRWVDIRKDPPRLDRHGAELVTRLRVNALPRDQASIIEPSRARPDRPHAGGSCRSWSVPRGETLSTRQASVKPSPRTAMDIDTVQVPRATKVHFVSCSTAAFVSILACPSLASALLGAAPQVTGAAGPEGSSPGAS
jgi:hypothetical protein